MCSQASNKRGDNHSEFTFRRTCCEVDSFHAMDALEKTMNSCMKTTVMTYFFGFCSNENENMIFIMCTVKNVVELQSRQQDY